MVWIMLYYEGIFGVTQHLHGEGCVLFRLKLLANLLAISLWGLYKDNLNLGVQIFLYPSWPQAPPKYRYANLLSLFLHLFFVYRHYFLFLKAYIQAGFCVRIVDEAEIIWRDLHFSKPSGQTPFQPFFVVF